MDIKDLMIRAHTTSVEKGWWDGFDDLSNKDKIMDICSKLLLMHSEISESVEELRNINPDTMKNKLGFDLSDIYYKTSDGDITSLPEFDGKLHKPEGFIIELIDVLVRVIDTSVKLGLPVLEGLQRKLAYNETRPHRHGGKII